MALDSLPSPGTRLILRGRRAVVGIPVAADQQSPASRQFWLEWVEPREGGDPPGWVRWDAPDLWLAPPEPDHPYRVGARVEFAAATGRIRSMPFGIRLPDDHVLVTFDDTAISSVVVPVDAPELTLLPAPSPVEPTADPWFTDPAYRTRFADVWWQARWSANPVAAAVVTDTLTLTDGTPFIWQTNALGVLRVRPEHAADLATKLRLAATGLERALGSITDA